MVKKTKSSPVSFSNTVNAASSEGETTTFVDQPAENNIHAGEEVVVADDPPTTPGTSADEAAADARKRSKLKTHESITSPYACDPVAIDVGPGLATYWVPKHFLHSPKWLTTDARGKLCLPGVSAATGHTLVHYLYTGTYQALEAKGENIATPAHIKFKQALSTFIFASMYRLQDLERLAKKQIEICGTHMALVEVLNTVRKGFSKMAWSWFHEYLLARAKKQLNLNYTFFTSKPFIESIGKSTLHRFMTCHLLEMFSEKLTHSERKVKKKEERLAREAKEAAEAAEEARITEEAPLLTVVSPTEEKRKKKRGLVEEKAPPPSSPPPTFDYPDADHLNLIKDIPGDQLLAELGEDLKTEVRREDSPFGEWAKDVKPEPKKEESFRSGWRSARGIPLRKIKNPEQRAMEDAPVVAELASDPVPVEAPNDPEPLATDEHSMRIKSSKKFKSSKPDEMLAKPESEPEPEPEVIVVSESKFKKSKKSSKLRREPIIEAPLPPPEAEADPELGPELEPEPLKEEPLVNPSAHTTLNNYVFYSYPTQATNENTSFMKDSVDKKSTNWRMRKSFTNNKSLEDHEVITTLTVAERKAFELEEPRKTGRIFSQDTSSEDNSTYGSVDEDAFLDVISKAEAEAELNSEPSVFPDRYPSRTSDTPQKPDPINVSVQPLPSSVASAKDLSSDTPTLYSRTDGWVESIENPSPVAWYIRNLPKSNLFVEELPNELISCPYFVSFIGCRIALINNVSLKDVMKSMDLSHARDSPNLFWNSFDEHLRTSPRDSSAIWDAAKRSFEGYTFKGKVVFENAISKPVFRLDLLPIQAEKSCLFQRMFGSDRFLYLTFPSLQVKPERFTQDQMPYIQAQWRLWMSRTHSFLGRKWRVFHVKLPKGKGQLHKVGDDAVGTRVILFAIEGAGINHVMSVGEMINGFFDFAKNQDDSFCKAYARLDLGLSRTIPTLTFKPSQIKRISDVHANLTPEARDFNDPNLDWGEQCHERPVMNDGCARISVGAALKIWEYYRTATGSDEPLPSAFQGRIGGAKGMWMISAEPHTRDPAHLETWIEVTKSQRKFEPVYDDEADDRPYNPHRLTFNYVKHSFISGSSDLCISFIPILVDRGVSRHTISKLMIDRLDQERKQLLEMLHDPVRLHNWITRQGSSTSALGILPWQAALPSSVPEKAKLLLRAGFCPVQSPYLARSLTSFVKQKQFWMEEKLKVPLSKATFLLGLADPLGILEPGVVHVQFSKPFLDEFDRRTYRNLEGEEVLVARQPACRRSDIQKMRAVSHPSLSHLVDVIVFPVRGEYPAAGKLQGGDYDGDVFWTCWEPVLVAPFCNAPAPLTLNPARYGIKKDTRKLNQVMNPHDLYTADNFLKEAFEFRMSQSLLGKVTVLATKVAYLENCIHSERLKVLYDVHDLLVDAPKQAYRFEDDDFNNLVQRQLKCGNPGVPAYKQAMEARVRFKAMGEEDQDFVKSLRHDDNNILDFLYFNVVGKHNRETRQALKAALPKEDDDDLDLQQPFLQLQGWENEILSHELQVLLRGIERVVQAWNRSFGNRSELPPGRYNKLMDGFYNMFRSLMPSPENTSHPQIAPLLYPYLGPKHPTIWETVRSSALYTAYPKKHSFVWHMAGRELARLKAGTDADTFNVVPCVFADLKTKPVKIVRPEDEENDS